jgi:hypothetical protein
MKKWELQLIAGLISAGLFFGCATGGGFTPQVAATASNAVTVAQGLLTSLDSFYGDLLKLKIVPDYTQQATRVLAMADQAATVLRGVISGATISDAQMNVVAGQVDGSRAILAGAK